MFLAAGICRAGDRVPGVYGAYVQLKDAAKNSPVWRLEKVELRFAGTPSPAPETSRKYLLVLWPKGNLIASY